MGQKEVRIEPESVDTNQTLPPLRSLQWRAWAGLLVGIYLAVAAAGWGRTLIGTEIWALYNTSRTFHEQMESIRQDLVHPPLIYLLERGWLHLFGQTDNAAKALPLVINIPAIVLFTLLASRVTQRWRLAAFLFCSAYLRVGSVTTLVRMYGLGVLWSVAAILLWDAWRKQPGASRLVFWAAVMVLLVYTHLFGLLLLAAFVIVNWFLGPRRWLFTAVASTVGLLFVPWLLYVLPVYLSRGLDYNLWWVHWLVKTPIRGLALLPFEYMGPMYVPRWRLLLTVTALIVHLALFAVACRSIRRLWPPHQDTGQDTRWFWTVLLLTGVPILLLFVFSVVITPAFSPRFVLGVLPAYWLLLVLLGEIGGRAGRWILYGVVLPWVVASISVALVRNWRPPPVRQVTSILTREHRDGDLILCAAGIGNEVYWDWTRRLGQPGRFRLFRPFPAARPLTPPQLRGFEHNERLSALPWVDLEEIDFSGLDRVWLLSSGKEMPVAVDLLGKSGFLSEKSFRAGPLFLSLFAKVPTHGG